MLLKGLLKLVFNEWTYLWNGNRLRLREQLHGCQWSGGQEGVDWEFWISRCKLSYIEWISNKVLLYSTGNYIQNPVINYNRKEYKKECICISEKWSVTLNTYYIPYFRIQCLQLILILLLPHFRNQTLLQWISFSCSCCSVVSDSLRPHGLHHSRLPVLHHHLKLAQIHVHWVSDAIQPSCPLLSSSPPAFNLSPAFYHSRADSSESALHLRWPKSWSFSFSISPFSEYSGLFDLLAVQGTLKSLLQHHSSKTSILWCSAFFMVQLSHPYMTTGKAIALTVRTFVSKVMSLLFTMLSRLVIAFLPKSNCLLFFVAAVTICSDFGAQENKVCHCFHYFPIYLQEVMGSDAMISVFWMLSFKPAFWLSSFTLIKRLFCSFSLSAIRVGKKDNKQCKQRVRRIIRMSLVEMPKQNIRDWLS